MRGHEGHEKTGEEKTDDEKDLEKDRYEIRA